MGRILIALTALLSMNVAFADCPNYAGNYKFACEELREHHEDFSQTFATREDAEGKYAVISIKQKGCSSITLDNKADSYSEYPIYFESDKNQGISVKTADLEDNKLTLKYHSRYGEGKDIVRVTMTQDMSKGTLKIQSKVQMSNILSLWIPAKISGSKCILTKLEKNK